MADVDHHAGADTLLMEAARLAPAAQAVEMNISAPSPAEYATLGNWSPVIPWDPHIPVSAALLADGRLLTFASNQRTSFPDGPQFTYAAVWDPATGVFTELNNPRHDMFCGGLSQLQDGRVMVNGGNGILGTTALASLFDWRTNEWSAAQTMPEGRWYNTSVALPGGEVFTAGGAGGDNGTGTTDQWNAISGWRRMSGINWSSAVNTSIPNAIEPNWHPFLLVSPDGRLAHFGPHKALNWITNSGTGSLTSAGANLPGTHYPKQGAWAMYDVGKVLVAGGLQAIDNGAVVKQAFTVDLNGPTPVVTPATPMANARSFSNSVVLPNGEVMVVGGTNVGAFFSDAGTIYTPEIWNPTTGQWRALADASVPRNYHSLALLLPDGRVWSGGGGLYGDATVDHQDAQVFTPPQLFQADGSAAPRPQILATPDRIGPGAVFTVNASPGVQYFSFIRLSSLTHSVNTDQRHLRFTHSVTAPGEYALTAPGSINVLTPGYWMMFAVDANGVWSVSRIMQVTNATLPVVTNPGTQNVTQNSAVSLPINASATGGALSYSSTGLPGGLAINSTTGLISGSLTAAPGTYRSTVFATAAGQVTSVSFNWIVVLPNLGSGQIMREWWTEISGTTVASLTADPSYPGTPKGRDLLAEFEVPQNWDDRTGQRVRGFLHVPVTGQYRFAISSDDQSALLLSIDANPANAVQIASQPDWTEPRAWSWYAQQTSALITLNAGTRYYIEAIMKEGGGGDHLAVGWQKPGDTTISVIAGTYLTPYLPVQNPAIFWSLEESAWNGTSGEVKASDQGIHRLNGTAGNGANTTVNNPALNGNPGTGRSAVFNGTSQSVIVPFNTALNPTDFTIAAWVRCDALNGAERCILASREIVGTTERGYSLWVSSAGRWQLRTGIAANALTGPAITPGQWTHLAATFDTTNTSTRAGIRRLYVNGVLVAEDSGIYQINASQPLVFGAAGSAGTAFFAGALDEVTLHQAPLSALDIIALRDLRHATEGGGGPQNQSPQLVNPGAQGTLVGALVSLPLSASDPENNPLTFSATGLPTGLTISPSSGVISGSASTAGVFNVTITATDTLSPPASAAFVWTVTNGITLQPLASNPKPSGAAQTYTAQAANGLNPRFKWNFGDGTPETAWSTSPTVSHTFANPGRYLVTLTATDDTGLTITSTFYQAVHAPLTAKKPNTSSSIAFQDLATGNDRVWCVNPDNNSVSAFDVVTRTRYAEIAVGTSPRALAFAPDGRLWVVNHESGTLSIINTSTRKVASTVTLARGSRPFGLVFDPVSGNGWMALEGTGRVLQLNPSNGAQTASIDVGGPVRHLSISADGTRLYASRFITPRVPGENTATPILTGTGGQIVVIGTAALAVQRTILINPSTAADTETSARGLPNYLGAAAISPDGLSAWVPSKQDNIQRGMLRDAKPLNHEDTVRSIVSRLDLTAQAEHLPSRVDIDNAGMPSAAAYDPWGIYVFTALEASREVAILDAWTRQEVLRFPTGRAPQGLTLSPDGGTLYVQNFMDRSISVHDVRGILSGGTAAPVTLATLNAITTEKLTAQVLQGKKLFYDAKDARLALQEYMSCATCHNEGGQDGRVWDLTGFGEGLRNTITLKGHGNHGTLHWTGNFDEVQDFEGQIRALAGGTGLIASGSPHPTLGTPNAGRSADLDALAAYVKSLTSSGTSPGRTSSGGLSSISTAGQQIFRAQNCAACHSGTTFTDSALNVFANIGTLKPSSGTRLGAPLTGLDVPTLRGVWATGPYLHDGSAATLAEAIAAHQGVVLSAADMAKLVAFVSCIDDAPTSAPLPFALALSTPLTTVTAAFNVTAIFNSSATGFALTDVVVVNGTTSNFTGTGSAYTFTVTPTASGPVTISVPANAATDSTALGNLASNVLTVNYGSTDNTPPTVALSTTASSVTAPFVVTATFSENVSGLLGSKFSVTNGTVTALSAAGAVWAATVTPATSGNVIVTLPANTAQDAAGNGNTVSNTLTVAYTPPPVVTNGVTADYFIGKNFEQLALNRVDADINFDWPASPAPGLPADGFSVRWQGSIVPPVSGAFDFITRSDDGVRLWLNGVLVINNWADHGESWDTITLNLQAGVPVTVKMEFYENGGGAVARLFWEGPGIAFSAVSSSALRPLEAASAPANQTLTRLLAPPATGDTLLALTLGLSNNGGVAQPGEGLQLVHREHTAVDAVLVRPAGQSAITFTLESTEDLHHWQPLALFPSIVNLGDGRERVTWSNLQNTTGLSLARGIVRLRVTQSTGTTAVTTPVGWQQLAPRAGIQSFGLNLTHPPVFTGAAQSANAAGITLSAQSTLASVTGPGFTCYIEIISGPQAGHRVELQSITASACVFSPDSPLHTISPAAIDWTSARFNIHPHVILTDVFDPARFQGHTATSSADQVLLHANGTYLTHWLYDDGTQRRWLLEGEPTFADQSGVILPPGTGVMLKIAATTPQPVLFAGSVRTTALARDLQPGYNLVANPWPIDTTPAAAGLTGPGFVASTQVASADQLQLWSGDANAALSGYTGYWLFQMPGQPMPVWISPLDPAQTSQNNTILLRAGRATFIKAQPQANRPVWIVPAP
uniref:PA14 domain-containing protein n=1 Tax=Prosthecobacter sp. TaxID=1965333 RepID=UPI0037844BBC